MGAVGRASVLLVALAAGALAAAAPPQHTLAEDEYLSDPAGPLWFSPTGQESQIYRVHVATEAGVVVEATAVSGLVQLHHFPEEGGALFGPQHVVRMDGVPAAAKMRSLGKGDWIVAVDPSVPRTHYRVTVLGTSPDDDAWWWGPWECPAYVGRGCLP